MNHEDIEVTTSPLSGDRLRVRATLHVVAEMETDQEVCSNPVTHQTARDHCRQSLVDKLYGGIRRDAENLRREIMRGIWRGAHDPIFKALQPLLDAGKHLEKP